MQKAVLSLEDERVSLEVDFNEPFMYVIVDTKTSFGEESIPLFMGVVTELINCDA